MPLSPFHDIVERCRISAYGSTTHRVSDIASERFDIPPQIICSFFIQWIGWIWFQKQVLALAHSQQGRYLQSIYNGVKVEHGFPIFTKNIKANISIHVNVWMIYLCKLASVIDIQKYPLSAADFGRLVRIFASNGE